MFNQPRKHLWPSALQKPYLLAPIAIFSCLQSSACSGGAAATPGISAPTPHVQPSSMPMGASSIRADYQASVEQELAELLRDWAPETASILILEPKTGEILAHAGMAAGAPADVALKSAYVTGSTFKSFTLAAALEAGAVSVTDHFDCENGKRTYPSGQVLEDSKPHEVLSVTELLAVSSNVGFSKVFDKLGGSRFLQFMDKLHLRTAPPVEGAAPGEVPSSIEDKSFAGGLLANGELAKATALQMAAGYAIFANAGKYVAPSLHQVKQVQAEQVISSQTAASVLSMLEVAVNGANSTGNLARIPGVRVAGKTGTSMWTRADGSSASLASFIGIVPAEQPRWVIFVGALNPRDSGFGGKVAAPVFAKVAARLLR